MKPFRKAVIHDIHLGHKRTLTSDIIARLDTHFSCDAFFSTIDMVVFAGDVFDGPLIKGSEEAIEIDLWIARVIRLAIKHNVLIRIVEGTPLHDRKQSKHFVATDEMYKKKAQNGLDLKYIDKLSIEYIERFDINVLYVPDECNGGKTDKTLLQVYELLAAHHLQQVDFAYMHGCFGYQIEYLPENKVHSEKAYAEIVKHLVYIGHVHTRSTKGNIVAAGSFDRLKHNEEEMKGFVRSVFEADGTHRTKFIDNPQAKIYKSIECKSADVSECLNLLEKQTQGLPMFSAVRVVAASGNPILSSTSVLQKRWPLLQWSTKAKNPKDKKISDEDMRETMSQISEASTLSVTADTLAGLLMERIAFIAPGASIIERCEKQIAHVKTALSA